MSNREKEKAYFVQRLGAFFIDLIIVAFVSSLLIMPFQTSSVQKLNKQIMDNSSKYVNQEISSTVYINTMVDLNYQLGKQTGISSVITILTYVIYYVVIQMKLGGQTLGKRLLKIKVVKNDDSDLTMNDMVLRGLINNSILCDILVIIFALINKYVYFYGSAGVQWLQGLIVIISIFMIIIRKDGRSIADMVAKTKVISLREE